MAEAFEIVREASRREVVERFLDVELEKLRYSEWKERFKEIRERPDAEFFNGAREFADSREDTNPFLVFTVGVRGDNRFLKVKRWVLAKCRIDAIYTLGINPAMTPELESVKWNLKRFSHLASRYPEFELERKPKDGRSAVVCGVERRDPRKEGSIALIDGSNRVVCMAAQGEETVLAYAGLFKV